MISEQIVKTVDGWIDEEELPVMAGIKVIKGFDPYEGMDDDEIEAYHDFMHWALTMEHEALLSISKPTNKYGFWPFEFDESGINVSAFNTADFERLHPNKFSKYHYILKKIFEKVKDLALMHSSISYQEGRQNTFRRYESYVDSEFRERLITFTERYKREIDAGYRFELKRKIGELNRRILECKKIWERYAPPEKWD